MEPPPRGWTSICRARVAQLLSCLHRVPASEGEGSVTGFEWQRVTARVIHDVDVHRWRFSGEAQLCVVKPISSRLCEEDLDEFGLLRADRVEIVRQAMHLRDPDVDGEPPDDNPRRAVGKPVEG
jgi:hypothetical protein